MDARTRWLNSVLGAAALLVAIGNGSVFAAEPDLSTDQGLRVHERVATCVPDADVAPASDPAPDRSGASRFELPSGEIPVAVDCEDLTDSIDPIDSSEADVADEGDHAEAAAASDDDDPNPHQVAIADIDAALPATDTGPEPSQVQIDARTAALIALVLAAVAWSGTQAREDSQTR